MESSKLLGVTIILGAEEQKRYSTRERHSRMWGPSGITLIHRTPDFPTIQPSPAASKGSLRRQNSESTPGHLQFLTPGKTTCQNPFSYLKLMISRNTKIFCFYFATLVCFAFVSQLRLFKKCFILKY